MTVLDHKYSSTIIFLFLIASNPVLAFVSGSTGADGPLNIIENTELLLPPSGIFNFTDVTVATGVTLTFAKNTSNSPVTILATGDITIDGTINVNGGNGGPSNDGTPGIGGPGGFNGGQGGWFSANGGSQMAGGDGQGPGRGTGAPAILNGGAGGGSYGSKGGTGSGSGTQGMPGPTYGNGFLLPLIGGSGGGGGAGGGRRGSGGGGGGGAILLAASGTVSINGLVSANGGSAGVKTSSGPGGHGSGGGVRIIATTIQGTGEITARHLAFDVNGVASGTGRIRLEAEIISPISTNPTHSFDLPGVVMVPVPSLRITSVGGITVPTTVTGHRDIELPGITTNPVTVEFETTGIPLGTIIILTAAPERGTAATANSNGVTGTEVNGTDAVSIDMPNGNSRLMGQTTFTVTAAIGDSLSNFAQGERVERIKVAYAPGKGSQTTLVTISGKEFTWPSNTVAMN